MQPQQPLLHQRIPGAESQMSAFSKDDPNILSQADSKTRLPNIAGAMQNQAQGGQGSGIQTNSPAKLSESPERSVSPSKTIYSANKTGSNFYYAQDKQKMDAAAERLIHSVNAVTDLLKANAKLRDNTERVQRELEDRDAEAFQLNIESQALRERLELVEGILKNNSQDYDELVSQQIKAIMEKSNTEYGKAGRGGQLKNIQPRVTTVDEVYTELIQLRNKNRALEGRIKQLEN